MKLRKRMIVAAAASVLAAGTAALSLAFATDYSTQDPLISKSYLESIFKPEITNYIDTKFSEKEAQTPAQQPSDDTVQSSAYTVITLTNGQTLSATSSLELILRPGGSATVVSDIPGNGIADLTGGSELQNGAEVPINAYCLIPRGDGRGIVCTSQTAYVMVRGNYEIK